MLAAADADLARRDRALRDLARVLDADAVAPLVRRALDIEAGELEPLYVRYKPATSCLVAYRVMAQGQPMRAYVKTHAHHGAGQPLVVNAFPADGRLRALPRLADDQSRHRLLARLLDERAAGPADLAVLAYKPERRFVGQVLVNGLPRAVVRAYRPLDFARAKTALSAFASTATRVPRVIGASARHRVLALEWIEGQRLDEVLASSCGAEAAATAGEALARLHRHHRGDLARSRADAEHVRLRTAADAVAVLWPPLASRAADVAERVIEAMPSLQLAAPVHGDFYARQVLLLPAGGVAIIDVDQAEFGDAMSDLAMFVAHLERDSLAGRLSPGQVASLRAALVEGYGLDGSLMTPEMLDARAAGALLRLAPHVFRERWPEWPHHMAAVISRAEELLRPATCHFLARKVDNAVAASDPALPALARALDVGIAWQAMAALPGIQELDATGLRSARILRYKPGRGCVVRYAVERRHGGSVPVLGKVGRSRPDWRTHAVQRTLWQGGFDGSGPEPVAVPEPLGVVAELNMWLQRHVPGDTATTRLLERFDPSLGSRVARAIRHVHASRLVPERTHTIADEWEIVTDRLARVGAFRPGWRRRLEGVAKRCRQLAAALETTSVAPIHRDFYPDHVLVHGSRLYLIDFDLCSQGDPALDAGNFIGHLLELAVRHSGSRAAFEECAAAFEHEFARLAGLDAAARVPGYVTMTLARHVYISTQFHDRRAHTEELLDLCERRLSGATAARAVAGG